VEIESLSISSIELYLFSNEARNARHHAQDDVTAITDAAAPCL
jgi:hypothetical protein